MTVTLVKSLYLSVKLIHESRPTSVVFLDVLAKFRRYQLQQGRFNMSEI